MTISTTRFHLKLNADEKKSVVLGERDFARFTAAVRGRFDPNPALLQALSEARRKIRRA